MKKKISKIFVFAGLMLFASALFATPPYGDPDQPYDKIPGTWETDHVKWARPLPGGKLKVLFIVPYVTAREVVELSQRLDLDYTVIMNCGRQTWWEGGYEGGNATPLKGAEAKAILQELASSRLSLGHKYDVIVIGDVSWLTIPKDIRDLILQHVERGTGLVSVSPNRLQDVSYRGLTIISGKIGEKAEGSDPQFESLFRQNENPAVAQSIIRALPFDIIPLKVLEKPEDFEKLNKHLRSTWHLYAQAPVHIAVSHHGKGRVLGLQYFDAEREKNNNLTSLTPKVRYEKVSYDYFHALLAKCVLWSAGRESSVAADISFKAPPSDTKPSVVDQEFVKDRWGWEYKTPAMVIARHDTNTANVVLSATMTNGQPVRASFDFTLRTMEGEIIQHKNIPVMLAQAKKAEQEIPIPPLARGNYLVDLKVKDQNGAVIDFVSKSFRVETDIQVAAVKTDKEIYAPGETIQGTVSFSGPLAQDQKAVIEVRDTWNRLVYKTAAQLDAERKGATFAAPVNDPLSQIWDIHGLIEDKAGTISSARTWVSMPNYEFGDFVWGQFTGEMPNYDWRGIMIGQAMRRFGLNGFFAAVLHGAAHQSELFERMHFKHVYYSEHLGQRILDRTDFTNEYSENCLSQYSDMCRRIADTGKMLDPKEFPYKSGWMSAEWMNAAISNRYLPARKFGSPIYVLNSENELLGEGRGREISCFCPLCTKKFQDWCRQSYNNDITKLNAEWNTGFKSFDEVRGILLQAAVEKNQMPRWVDFRYFMRSYVFTQLHLDWTAMIRRFIPQARTGEAAWENFDYSRCREYMNSGIVMTCPVLGDLKLELHQSFGNDQGFFMGPGNTLRFEPEFTSPLQNIRYPWHYLFLGCSGLISGMEYYNMLGGGNYLTADFSEPLPFFKNIGAEIDFLQRGIAKLINTSTSERSKVAILWTPYNHYISRLFPFEANKFSSGNCVVGGGAHADCLIMMNSLRIRPTYISQEDLAAGVLEGKGYKALILPYNKGMSEKEAEVIRDFVRKGGLVIADNEPGICSEHGKILKTPRLPELFPITTNKNIVRYGKGVAAYIPDEINGYHARFTSGNYTGSDSVATLLRDYAGVEPPIEFIDSRGLPRRDTLLRVFKNGSALYVGILQDMASLGKEPDVTTIRLPQKYHVWDARKQRYLGYLDMIEANLDYYPRFYALLPACPGLLRIEPEKKTVNRGEIIQINGEIQFVKGGDGSAMGQVVHFEVYDPSGNLMEHFRSNKSYTGEKFSLRLPISLSEPAGRYTVEAACPVTGLKASACFDVVGN